MASGAVASYACTFGHRYWDGTVLKQLTCDGEEWQGTIAACDGTADVATIFR